MIGTSQSSASLSSPRQRSKHLNQHNPSLEIVSSPLTTPSTRPISAPPFPLDTTISRLLTAVENSFVDRVQGRIKRDMDIGVSDHVQENRNGLDKVLRGYSRQAFHTFHVIRRVKAFLHKTNGDYFRYLTELATGYKRKDTADKPLDICKAHLQRHRRCPSSFSHRLIAQPSSSTYHGRFSFIRYRHIQSIPLPRDLDTTIPALYAP
jgi:hypothetical protein